jgi:thiopeptide-type bacteriocin biosynthesis protein
MEQLSGHTKEHLYPYLADGSTWLSAHLFCMPPWEPLLVQAVQPFVQELLNKEWITGWFFIRYWEKGPHIRLRLRGQKTIIERDVKPLLEQHFKAWFAANPTQRNDLDASGKLHPFAENWFPNDSVIYIDYEPEIERYGGKEAGIAIAEDHFQSSSTAVTGALAQNPNWTYSRSLGMAIQLHTSFAHCCGFSRTEALALFNRLYEAWLPHAYYHETLTDEATITRKREEVLEAFRITFEKHKPQLAAFAATLWQALSDGEEFADEWFNQWLQEVKATDRNFREVRNSGKIVLPAWYGGLQGLDEPTMQQFAVYESYFHMTNNRLGLFNRDEAYVAYIICEIMTELLNS